MNITESWVKQLLANDTVVASLPFMHQLTQDYRNRLLSHKSQPGCSSCKGPAYVADLVAKAICLLSSLGESDKQKLRSYLKTKEDIVLVTNEHGVIKKRPII